MNFNPAECSCTIRILNVESRWVDIVGNCCGIVERGQWVGSSGCNGTCKRESSCSVKIG